MSSAAFQPSLACVPCPRRDGEVSSAFPGSEYVKERNYLWERRFWHIFLLCAIPKSHWGHQGEDYRGKTIGISSLTSFMTADPKAGKIGTGDDLTGSKGIN